MGCNFLNSSSFYDSSPPVNLNPDPKNYKILEYKTCGKFLILKVNYPDCKNYEGNKILVYENVSILDIVNQKTIDPHFCNNKNFHSPIARFEPTEKGMLYATKFASISNEL